MSKLTLRFLQSKGACSDGVAWFKAQKETDIIKVLHALEIDNHWNWANWLIVRVMSRPQYLSYAIFAAEQVIETYEKRYPGNAKPRRAIEAAKAVLKNDTPKNRDAAYAAADAADAYADAADATYADAAAAAYAAYAAAYAADAYGAAYATYAADAAADAAAADAYADALRKKILEYGISLLKKENK